MISENPKAAARVSRYHDCFVRRAACNKDLAVCPKGGQLFRSISSRVKAKRKCRTFDSSRNLQQSLCRLTATRYRTEWHAHLTAGLLISAANRFSDLHRDLKVHRICGYMRIQSQTLRSKLSLFSSAASSDQSLPELTTLLGVLTDPTFVAREKTQRRRQFDDPGGQGLQQTVQDTVMAAACCRSSWDSSVVAMLARFDVPDTGWMCSQACRCGVVTGLTQARTWPLRTLSASSPYGRGARRVRAKRWREQISTAVSVGQPGAACRRRSCPGARSTGSALRLR